MKTGIAIRRIRAGLNITLAELAEMGTTTISILSFAEQGRRELPDEVVKRILRALKMSEREFQLVAAQNPGLLRTESGDGGVVFNAVKHQYLARSELRLSLQ